MKEIFRTLYETLLQRLPVATGTIVVQSGSAPRGEGAKLLADQRGLILGTIGGGLSEAQTIHTCAEVLELARPRLLDINMDGQLAANADMICGGRVRVLVEPWFPDSTTLDLCREILDVLEKQGGLLLTGLEGEREASRCLYADGVLKYGELPPEALEDLRCLLAKQPYTLLPEASLITLAGHEYFVEPCVPPWRMILVGGGHVSRPTAQIAALAGFEVHVIDDRPEFATPERFPWAESVNAIPDFTDCFNIITPDNRTCVIIVTRGHLFDGHVLKQALETQAGYLGMIGSRRKRDALYASLREQGVSDRELARVHCPIGLSIGAETPAEIAVSIVAECIAHVRTQ